MKTEKIVYTTAGLLGAYLLFKKKGLPEGIGQNKEGSFAGFGEFEIIPSLKSKFRFGLDMQDFYGRPYNQRGIKLLKLQYTPADRNVTDRANSVVVKLQNLAKDSPEVTSLLSAWTKEGDTIAQRIFDTGEGTAIESVALGARGLVDVFGTVLENQVEAARIESFNQLKSWIQKIANFNVGALAAKVAAAKAAEEAAANSFTDSFTQTPPSGNSYSPPASGGSTGTSQGASTGTAQRSPTGSTGNGLAVKKSNTLVYVGAGVAALVILGGLGVFIAKRKK